MSDVAADALVDKGEILVEYAKPYGLNRSPSGNLASLGISKPKMFFEPRRVSAYNFYINVESELKLELIMSQNFDCCTYFSENAASLPCRGRHVRDDLYHVNHLLP